MVLPDAGPQYTTFDVVVKGNGRLGIDVAPKRVEAWVHGESNQWWHRWRSGQSYSGRPDNHIKWCQCAETTFQNNCANVENKRWKRNAD